jgi:hypothetical protein
MKRIALFLIIIFAMIISCEQKENIKSKEEYNWKLPYETSGYTKTSTYDEAIIYSKQLAEYSPIVEYTSFGESGQGYDLPLLIIDKNQNFTPEKVRESGNAVFLIEANIHPGEPEGIDAGFLLIRDLVIDNKYPELLENITILFIPSFNVDGHRRFMKYSRINQNGPEMMGWRTTAKNLNLNRDFLKADAIEMQYWLQLFNQWLPDFFADCHTTDGADYQYAITYGLEINGNMNPTQTKWQKEKYLDPITKMMEESEHPIFPYVAFRRWHDPRSGLRSWVAKPMLSEGYTAIQNRPGLLIETHMLKAYKQRVDATYYMLLNTLEILDKEYAELVKINIEADEFVKTSSFRDSVLHVDFKPSSDSTMVIFKGIDYTVDESEITGGPWFKYGDKPIDMELPFFNKLEPIKSVKLPDAYIISPEWTEIIYRLEIHGIELTELEHDTSIIVKSYKFSNIEFGHEPYEGRQKVTSFDIKEIEEERFYPSGSYIIDMNQRTARIIAHILEPEAPDSYLQWGFFNTIFEQKEYGETYVMEKMAREMFVNDPDLLDEFNQFKKENPEIANNQWLLCNWLYSKTPYWDARKDVYPIGKIFN